MTDLATIPDLLGTSPADLLIYGEGGHHDSTPEEARQRADRLRGGIVGYALMRQDIADAFACRDWIALGYDNWAAYAAGEFGELLAQLSRGERQQAVADLRGQGMSTRQIADATGVSPMQVRRDLAQVGPDVPPATVTGKDNKQHPASRPTPTPGPVDAAVPPPADPGATPEPGADLSTAQPGSGTPAPAADAPAPPQEPASTPEPDGAVAAVPSGSGSTAAAVPGQGGAAAAPKPTLTLVPDVDQERAAKQRDARALLVRVVELLSPTGGKPEYIETWARRLGPYDEELAALVQRAHAALAALDDLISEAGR